MEGACPGHPAGPHVRQRHADLWRGPGLCPGLSAACHAGGLGRVEHGRNISSMFYRV